MVNARQFSVAACAIEVRAASREIQLIPAGPFRGLDGKPTNAPHWHLDVALATQWLAALKQRKTPFVIDYEHQTLRAAENGKPAPAAGRFTAQGLEIRDGSLWATDVEWTAAAKASIEAEEYFYISPVFPYRKDGTILGLFNAALTNTPNIDGMEPVFRAAASQFSDLSDLSDPEEPMNEEIRKALGLADDADDDAVLAACNQVIAERDAAVAAQQQAEQQLATNSQDPDPERYVSVEVATELRNQVAALSQQVNQDKVTALVDQALEDGRLLPAQKDWANKLGEKDIAALTQYLESAEPIAGLRAGQSGGNAPSEDADGMTAEDLAVCQNMGIQKDDYLKANAGVE